LTCTGRSGFAWINKAPADGRRRARLMLFSVGRNGLSTRGACWPGDGQNRYHLMGYIIDECRPPYFRGKWPIERVNKRRAFGAENETWTDGSTFELEPYWAADKLTSPWGLSPFGPFIYGRRTRVIAPSVLQWKQTKKATGSSSYRRNPFNLFVKLTLWPCHLLDHRLCSPLCTGRRREKDRDWIH
jgi:hypothetical protein